MPADAFSCFSFIARNTEAEEGRATPMQDAGSDIGERVASRRGVATDWIGDHPFHVR